MYRILTPIPGTPAYFKTTRSELQSIIHHLGPPTFFITLSGRIDDPRSVAYLKEINAYRRITPELDNARYLNVVGILLYLNQIFTRVLNLLRGNKKVNFWGSGKYCEQTCTVTEFQDRGTPHTHTLIWLKGFEEFRDEANPTDLIEYLDTIITTDKEQLSRCMKGRQTHTCIMGRCISKKLQYCKANYPMLPLTNSIRINPNEFERSRQQRQQHRKIIRDLQKQVKDEQNDHLTPQEFYRKFNLTEKEVISMLSSLWTRVVFLPKRKVLDHSTVAFNRIISSFVGSNTNVEFLFDYHSAIEYITPYFTKGDLTLKNILTK